MKKVIPSAAQLIADLKLPERLAAAMAKAGYADEVVLSADTIHQDYYDVSGIVVKTATASVEERALYWVRGALIKAGVVQMHVGAWQGPCSMGEPAILHHVRWGEKVAMVSLVTCSIGD
jgi:hypothetical protein